MILSPSETRHFLAVLGRGYGPTPSQEVSLRLRLQHVAAPVELSRQQDRRAESASTNYRKGWLPKTSGDVGSAWGPGEDRSGSHSAPTLRCRRRLIVWAYRH
jgi:hypothetical protein